MKAHTLLTAAILIVVGCKKEEANGWTEKNGNVPAPVTNIQVQNGNGAAVISYSIPQGSDALYVKAVYTLGSGAKREVKASFYTNQLKVDGFADTLKHTVQLYTVSRSEV